MIENALVDLGADAVSTGERLAGFHRVENTYLSTFQTLGGLGLLLGTVGLGHRPAEKRARAEARTGAAPGRRLSPDAFHADGGGREHVTAGRGACCWWAVCRAGHRACGCRPRITRSDLHRRGAAAVRRVSDRPAILDHCRRRCRARAVAGRVEVGVMTAFARCVVAASVVGMLVAPLEAENWPQWRGPSLNGVSSEINLPVRWSKTENVAWKLALPAWSGSTPIVWGDRIFLNVSDGRDLSLWCVDRANGTVLWRPRLGGGDRRQQKQNMSSPSPVTDGRGVWVMTGTGVLKAFDFDGKELWARDIQKDYGALRPAIGLRLVTAAVRGFALRAGPARDEHRRSLVRAADQQGQRPDDLAGRAPDQCARRIAGCVHDTERSCAPDRRPRSSSRAVTWSPATIRTTAGNCGARTASIRPTIGSLPDCGLADCARRSAVRAVARAADCWRSKPAAAAMSASPTCSGRSTTVPTCRRR